MCPGRARPSTACFWIRAARARPRARCARPAARSSRPRAGTAEPQLSMARCESPFDAAWPSGQGTRMRSATPKHLHPLLGRRMVDWVIGLGSVLGADPLVVVASPETAEAFEGIPVAIQPVPLGTGDAVRCARDAAGEADDVLV